MAGRILAGRPNPVAQPRPQQQRPAPRPGQPQPRIAVGAPTGARSNVPRPGQRTFDVMPMQRPRPTSGLGGFNASAFAQAQGLGQSLVGQKTPFTCIEPTCFRLLRIGGPAPTALFKKNGEGPYCDEHWRDEEVCHQTQRGPCCFGVRYDEDQIKLMERMIKADLPNQIRQQHRLPPNQPVQVPLGLLNAAIQAHPALRCEQRCRNQNCGQIVVWWPDPKMVFGGSLAAQGVVG